MKVKPTNAYEQRMYYTIPSTGTCFGLSVLSVETGMSTQQHRFTWMVIQYTIAHGILVTHLHLYK